MKAQKDDPGIDLPSLNVGAGRSGWPAPRPGHFTSGKKTRHPLYRMLSGPQGRSGRVWRTEIYGPREVRTPEGSSRSQSLYRLSYPLKFILSLPVTQHPQQGLCHLLLEVSRSHSRHTTHSVGLFWTSDQSVAETSTWQHTNAHKRQTSIPPVGLEPTIPASSRPKAHALDFATIGIGREVRSPSNR
jgi:hypothetical protein